VFRRDPTLDSRIGCGEMAFLLIVAAALIVAGTTAVGIILVDETSPVRVAARLGWVIFGALIAAWVLVFGSLGAWVASQKGRSLPEGAILGILFAFFGVLLEALLPEFPDVRYPEH
jgi:uncharacterized YccA/Bax inhibitor family protein